MNWRDIAEDIVDAWKDGTILKLMIAIVYFAGFVAFIAFLLYYGSGYSLQYSIMKALYWFVICVTGYSLGFIISLTIIRVFDL